MSNMKHLSERLAWAKAEKEKLEGRNISWADMARACGASPAAVSRWKNDLNGIDAEYARPLASFLGVHPIWLETGEGSPHAEGKHYPLKDEDLIIHPRDTPSDFQRSNSNIRAFHTDDPVPEDTVLIKQSKVYFSAGDGHEASYEIVEDSEPASYQLSWFIKNRINPENCRRFKVTGDSQEPFLYENDTVLVNLAEKEIVDGKLYAIRYGNDLRLKYLSRRLDGTLILRSKNPAYRDEEVPPGIAEEHITIIGRVRDKSGTGGL